MKILVSGASGFIGRAIVERLLYSGHEVIALHSRVRPDDASKPYRVVIGNLADPSIINILRYEVGYCDAIIHAAATLNLDWYAPDVVNVNCVGTQNLLGLAVQWKCSHFIFLSSLPVIGLPRIFPIDEDHPTTPETPYHASKLFGEHLVRLASLQGCYGVSLRITAPVGPGMPKSRLLTTLVRRASINQPLELLGLGSRKQNYVDIRDIAQVAELALYCKVSGVFNIAASSCISNLDLARRCINLCRSESSVIFNGREDPEEGILWEVSIKKARRDLGFMPLYSIDAAIEAAITDFRNENIQVNENKNSS